VKGASLLTGPFNLYSRTNSDPIKEGVGGEIGSYYNTVADFATVEAGLVSSPQHTNGPIDKRATKDAMLPRCPAE
jgi:hypothetical protein